MTPLDPTLPGNPPRPRILLVEDDVAASRGLSRLLQAHGFTVTVAHDGAMALAALSVGPPPDFVLSDLQLPDLDGREIARFNRTLNPTPRFAIITGWDLELSAQQRLESGIDWILAKPLYVEELLVLLGSTRRAASVADEGKTT